MGEIEKPTGYDVINAAAEHAKKVWDEKENPLLTQRLVDCFYRNFGKFVCASTLLGMGVAGFSTFSAMRGLDNSSFPVLAKEVTMFGVVLFGGALTGFTGSYIVNLGISLLEETAGNFERNIRNRFKKN